MTSSSPQYKKYSANTMVSSQSAAAIGKDGKDVDVLFRYRRSTGDAEAVGRGIAISVLTEVIQSQRENVNAAIPTPTEYFGGCMVVLESVPKQAIIQQEHAHFLFLLTVVLPSVPLGILRRKYEECLKILANVLKAAQRLKDPVLLTKIDKYIIICFGIILKNIEHNDLNGAWMRPFTLSAFQIVLQALPDSRPKVRKAAQVAVLGILNETGQAKSKVRAPHKLVGEVCVSVLESCNVSDCTSTLQLLSFLRQGLVVMKSGTKKVVLEIVKLTELGHSDLARYALITLDSYLSKTSSEDSEKKVKYDKALLKGLLEHMTKLPESHMRLITKDASLCKAWTGTLENAFMRLVQQDRTEAMLHLDEVANALVSVLCESSKMDVAASPTMSLSRLASDCVDGSFAATKLLQACSKFTLPQYQQLWSQAFNIYAKMFDKLKKDANPCMMPILCKLVVVRESVINPITGADKEKVRVPWKGAVENVVRSAIKALGVEVFLSAVPLKGNGQKGVKSGVAPSRAWVLPLLSQALREASTTLEFFRVGILKIAAECEELSKDASLGPATAKVQSTRAMQLWALFPGFCQNASDISQQGGFSALAPVLAQALENSSDYPEVTDTICEGLQALIDDIEGKENDLEVISSFSRNFLPLLFNCYSDLTKNKKSERAQRVHRLVATYSKLAPSPLLNALFKQLLKQMLLGMSNAENASVQKLKERSLETRTLASLSLALIPCLEESSITLLYRVVRPCIEDDSDQLLQKSGYKVLEAICEYQTKWVLERREELISLMRTSLLATSASAKTSRLRCLQDIVRACTDDPDMNAEKCTELVAEILGEVMLCTKESNNKARMAAFKLLITLASCMEAVFEKEGLGANKGVEKFLEILVGGLAAETPHMRSAVVVSMCRIFTEYGKREDIQDHIMNIARTTLLLSNEKSREVAKSVIGFAKVCAVRLLPESTEALLDDIIKALLPWANDSKNRFSLKIRVIFERLTKKHGEALLKSNAIPADHKILTYINKQAAYKRRRHERLTGNRNDDGMDDDSMDDEGGSDIDSEDENPKNKMNMGGNKKRKRSDNGADVNLNDQIIMDEREGQVDLLDASALGKVSIKRDRTRRDSEDSDDSLIEFTSDGRLKINDDDESDDNGGDKFDDSDDDSISDFDGIDNKERKTKMKKHQGALETVKRKKQKVDLEGSAAYKGKKAGGDVKKKGTKIEPYAYIRLDPKLLNKRRKHEASRQFKGIGKSRLRQSERGRQAKGGRSKANKRQR